LPRIEFTHYIDNTTAEIGSLLSSGKVLEVLHQLLYVLQGNCVVVAGAHTANAAVALETLEEALLGTCQELLLLRIISAVDAEADVHAATDALVGHNPVHLGVLVQSSVDEIGLLIGNLLLPADLLLSEGRDKVGHDLARNPEVEDREGVVEGVVLSDSSIVKNNGPRETTNVQPVQKGRRGSCGLRGKKVLANDGNGDSSNTDILLSAAL